MRLALLALVGLTAGGPAEAVPLEGRVLQRLTREPVPAAQVAIDEARLVLPVDSLGRFHVELPGPGVYRIRASAPLHLTSPWSTVTVGGAASLHPVLIELDPETYRVPTVEIYASRIRPDPPRAPTRLLLASDIRRAPAGFQDPLRALQESRAVEARNDVGTLLSIRGGEPDQILFLMDGFDAYNPYRMRIVLGGGLSLANPDLVESVELFAGGFSARYGNRTSGLIRLRTREGNRLSFRSRMTLSMIAASTALEGPLPRGRGSWILGLRRTYYDLLVRPERGERRQYPYLQEAQGRIDWDATVRQKLTLRSSVGDEGVSVLFEGEGDGQDVDTDGSATTGHLSLEHRWTLARNLTLTTRAAGLGDRSRFDLIGAEDGAVYADATTTARRYASSHEWEIALPPHLARIGVSLDRYESKVDWRADSDPSPSLNPTPATLQADDHLTYRALHMEDVVALRPDWFLSLGVRFEDASGASPPQASPRVALRGALPAGLRFQVGLGHFLQYPDGIQAFSREAPLWISDLSSLPPERAEMASAGLSGSRGRFEGTIEAYHRDTRDLLVPIERASYRAEAAGRARARGVEIDLAMHPLAPDTPGLRWHERLEVRLAHAWSESRFRGGVFTSWTRVASHRTHSFHGRAQYPLSSRMTMTAVLRLASGVPYTPLSGRFAVTGADGELSYRPIWGEALSEVACSYARLDLRLERTIDLFGKRGALFLEILNATDRANTVSLVWNRDLVRRRPIRGLPFLPFLGLSLWS